jgi:DNA processing protein
VAETSPTRLREPQTALAAVVSLLRAGRQTPSIYAKALAEGVDPTDLLEAELASSRRPPAGSGRAAEGEGENPALQALKDEMAQQALFTYPSRDPAGIANRGGSPSSGDPLRADSLMARARADVARWQADGISLVAISDPAYPRILQAGGDGPPLLFVRGQLPADDDRRVAVIGSRQASPAGADEAAELARQLVAGGYTVVSGLAAGIDTAAHLATIEAGGRTLAVLGTGVSRCYPPSNAVLQRTIGRVGALVSRFWPEAGPERRSFPIRNALMSGLSFATVIVEASQVSGTRTAARHAIAHARPVLLASRLRSLPWARELAERHVARFFDAPEQLRDMLDSLAVSALPLG